MSFQSNYQQTKEAGNSTNQSQPMTSSGQESVNNSGKQVGPTNRVVVKPWEELPQEKNNMKTKAKKKVIGVVLVAVLFGIGTGFIAAYLTPARQTQVADTSVTQEEDGSTVKKGAIFGSADTETFKDETMGVLIKGGIDGEGSHTLLRPGGESQNVYLTSSVVDLDMFVDMEIKVWGETFKGQKAGWLMDVGRVEVLGTSATKPDWYQAN